MTSATYVGPRVQISVGGYRHVLCPNTARMIMADIRERAKTLERIPFLAGGCSHVLPRPEALFLADQIDVELQKT